MKLLKIGKYLINSQCIAQAWTNSDASEIKVYLSCSNSAVGVVSPCFVENENKLDKLDAVCLDFYGEEAEILKSYFTNPEWVCDHNYCGL